MAPIVAAPEATSVVYGLPSPAQVRGVFARAVRSVQGTKPSLLQSHPKRAAFAGFPKQKAPVLVPFLPDLVQAAFRGAARNIQSLQSAPHIRELSLRLRPRAYLSAAGAPDMGFDITSARAELSSAARVSVARLL